jgi:hypothetical protein
VKSRQTLPRPVRRSVKWLLNSCMQELPARRVAKRMPFRSPLPRCAEAAVLSDLSFRGSQYPDLKQTELMKHIAAMVRHDPPSARVSACTGPKPSNTRVLAGSRRLAQRAAQLHCKTSPAPHPAVAPLRPQPPHPAQLTPYSCSTN